MKTTAAQWVARKDRGFNREEAKAFELWKASHPSHAEEFARIGAAWRGLNGISAVSRVADEADLIWLRAKKKRERRRRMIAVSGWLAAAASIALAWLGWMRMNPPPKPEFRVLESTSRAVTLSDGSVARLNGASRIEPDYTAGERRVRLLEGEAFFAVAKNPARPFYVVAGPVTVQAVGTAFDVRLGSSAVEVTVTEGRVQVNDSAKGTSLLPGSSGQPKAAQVLPAGERVVVNLEEVVDDPAKTVVASLTPGEIDRSLAWQTTRLSFNDTPLDEVVEAFNRYNDRKLKLGDAALRGRKITGVFQADNLDGFTRLLEAGVDVKAEPRGDRETVLLADP